MFDNVKADLARFQEETGGGSMFRILARGLVSQGFQAILVYRFFRWFHLRGIPTQPFRFMIERLTEIMTGISIPAETEIGKGLRIHHFGGVIFHSHVKMGEHCTLYHGVTLGDKGGAGEPPTVGHNVLIGAGAKVLGEIYIGDNAIIGANSVVIKPVSDGKIVGGVPAKVIGENLEPAYAPQPKKIHVMQCRSTYTTGGGPDKTVLLIGEKYDKDKFEMVLMYMRGAADDKFMITTWARERGLNIHEVLEYKKLDFSNLRDIHRLIKNYRIDIFHARDYKTCFLGYLLRLVHPWMKLVFTAHGWVIDSAKQKFYTWLNLFSLKKYDKMIAVSQATKQMMLGSGLPPEKIEIVLNAIDVNTWQRDKVDSNIREELNIPASANIVGVVGRLRYEKDIASTLKVAQRVIQKLPDTYFLIVGDGPDREEAERTAQEMGLAEKILFLGFRKDTIAIYAEMDLFVSTSLMEGTPNTVLEAIAMEVPVVHTNVGGVPELIRNGYDGILCKVGDVDGIAKEALSILTDNEKAATLRRNGRDTACTKFSFESRLRRIEGIYEKLAA